MSNKEVAKLRKTLDVKEKQREQTLSIARTELKSAEEDLAKLRVKMDNASALEDFRGTLREIRELEEVQEYCKKRLSELEREPTLTDSDARQIKNDAKRALTSIFSAYIEPVHAEVDKLYKLLEDYYAEVDEVKEVLKTIGRLRHESVTVFNTDGLCDFTNPFDRYGHFIGAYTKCKEGELRKAVIEGKM